MTGAGDDACTVCVELRELSCLAWRHAPWRPGRLISGVGLEYDWAPGLYYAASRGYRTIGPRLGASAAATATAHAGHASLLLVRACRGLCMQLLLRAGMGPHNSGKVASPNHLGAASQASRPPRTRPMGAKRVVRNTSSRGVVQPLRLLWLNPASPMLGQPSATSRSSGLPGRRYRIGSSLGSKSSCG